ncbi:G Protein, Alpha subunit family member (gpa-2) [Reticulomyxa filosa]|uniref:G Protein, Alpha subunit family member (Gpa-2) n=1 Tax=Reticulomyxa filosa TaxID=46433 RepID=X6MRT8_RETFI|nr:G Protein, Alpha subunit family member (gpa-2) [Reticulomyxa filosa]|eukprot:ETO16172.1 G Protein, Alpha subunit family member (gpa-2) [Reticulomyxa filosa]
MTFHITDIGGVKYEEKKWINYIHNVSNVIFVAALNHYNAVLFEDETRNAMHESLAVFSEYDNALEFQKAGLLKKKKVFFFTIFYFIFFGKCPLYPFFFFF